MKIKTAISFDTNHAIRRGLGSVVELWPNRVAVIGDQESDRKRLMGDWVRLSKDIARVYARETRVQR